MFIKYCDFCGEEITKKSNGGGGVTAEMQTRKGVGDPNRNTLKVRLDEIEPCGDLGAGVCKYCLLDAIGRADDRARESQEAS